MTPAQRPKKYGRCERAGCKKTAEIELCINHFELASKEDNKELRTRISELEKQLQQSEETGGKLLQTAWEEGFLKACDEIEKWAVWTFEKGCAGCKGGELYQNELKKFIAQMRKEREAGK